VELSTDAGKNYVTLNPSEQILPETKIAEWNWQIDTTILSSKHCKIRISSYSNPDYHTQNEGYFAILPNNDAVHVISNAQASPGARTKMDMNALTYEKASHHTIYSMNGKRIKWKEKRRSKNNNDLGAGIYLIQPNDHEYSDDIVPFSYIK
jgi:hypothetical protein